MFMIWFVFFIYCTTSKKYFIALKTIESAYYEDISSVLFGLFFALDNQAPLMFKILDLKRYSKRTVAWMEKGEKLFHILTGTVSKI